MNPVLAFIASNLNGIIHWIFAIEYFELALKFEMMLGHIKSDIERQFRQKNNIILLLNACFFLFLIVNTSLYFAIHEYYLSFYNVVLLA